MTFKVFLNLIKFKNYIKNLIIFLPLFLNYTSWSLLSYTNLIGPIIFFSLLTSSIYIINDLKDLDVDKKHKNKKNRPIASGIISIKSSKLISSVLAVTSFFYFFLFSNIKVFILVLIYFVINIFYSFFFKRIKYLDIISISSGFLIRILIGSLISNIMISNFLLLQVTFFSIFIIICKRRELFYAYDQKVGLNYNIKELNILSKLFLILNILNYFIYIFYENRFLDSLSIEISFFIFSFLIIRYYNISMKNINFDPVYIYFNDKYLIIVSNLYLINFILGFYGIY